MSVTLIKENSFDNATSCMMMITHNRCNYKQGTTISMSDIEMAEVALYVITKIVNNTTYIVQKCNDQSIKTRYNEIAHIIII
jgi:hypothetical protein